MTLQEASKYRQTLPHNAEHQTQLLQVIMLEVIKPVLLSYFSPQECARYYNMADVGQLFYLCNLGT
jgi:hypothetical protein